MPPAPKDRGSDEIPHYQCVGVGIGPANLSLACLLHPHPTITNLFFDRREAAGWHDGQLLPGTTLQVSMLKDLVTLADPTNPYSFLAYLHSQGRIYHFINAKFDAVPRREFRNYLVWASRRNPNLRFGNGVHQVDFDGRFIVHTDNGRVSANNLVIGVGSWPWLPPQALNHIGPNQFHVSDFLDRARDLGGKRVVVIGGGQSGAEAFSDLIARRHPDLPRRVTWVSRRANFFPIDDSPFTNDFYMPSHSEYFFGWDPARQKDFNTRFVLSSDGISPSTLNEIYRQVYVHRFIDGADDLVALYPGREVTRISRGQSEGWQLEVVDSHRSRIEHIDADVVIWATGFRTAEMGFLDPIADRMDRDGDEFRIDRHFAVTWDGPTDRNIFVQNAARRQRGLADPNLSLLAWRSQRILDRLRGVDTDDQADSFIEWAGKLQGDHGDND